VRLNETPVIEYRPLDDGVLLSLLATWTDDATVRRILVAIRRRSTASRFISWSTSSSIR
jgi:hypothetical protein